jgi:hypothetical protein
MVMGKRLIGDLGVDWRMVLNCGLEEQDMGVWTGLNWLRIGFS